MINQSNGVQVHQVNQDQKGSPPVKVSHMTGLSLLADSAAARMPLTADRPNMREQLLAKAVEKKQVCFGNGNYTSAVLALSIIDFFLSINLLFQILRYFMKKN